MLSKNHNAFRVQFCEARNMVPIPQAVHQAVQEGSYLCSQHMILRQHSGVWENFRHNQKPYLMYLLLHTGASSRSGIPIDPYS